MRWSKRLILYMVLLAVCLSSYLYLISRKKPVSISPSSSPPLRQSVNQASSLVKRLPLPLKHEEGYRLENGIVRRHVFHLEQGQIFDAKLEQRGVDVKVRILGPKGEELFVVDSPIGRKGVESLLFLARVSGSYSLEVSSDEAGYYSLQVPSIRQADEKECIEAEAERLFHHARESSLEIPDRADAKDPLVVLVLKELDEAAALWRKAGNRERRADAIERAGKIWNEKIRNWDQAISYHKQARNMFHQAGDRDGEARMLTSIGTALVGLKRFDDAEDNYKQAILLASKCKALDVEASALRNLGILNRKRGDLLGAQEKFERSLSLWKEVGDRPDQESYLLSDVLHIYAQLERYQNAIKLAEKWEPRLEAFDPIQRGQILTRLGEIYLKAGDWRGAHGYAVRAVDVRKKYDKPEGLAVSLAALGLVYREMKDLRRSTELQQEALLLFRKAGKPIGEATALINLGVLLYEQKNLLQAIHYFEEGLKLAQEEELQAVQVVALYSLALAERELGNRLMAKKRVEDVLKLLDSEELGARIEELEDEYQEAERGSYDLLIELSLSASERDVSLALEASESSKRRVLLGAMGPLRLRPAALSRASPDLRNKYSQLRNELDWLREEYRRLEGRGLPTASLEADTKGVMESLRAVSAEIQRADPWYSTFTPPRPISRSQVQELLDDDTALLAYHFTRERGFLFLVTGSSLEVFDLPPPFEIEHEVETLLKFLDNRYSLESGGRAASIAERLSQILLGPVADRLGSLRLAIIPDGPVHYVPFAALPLPGSGDFLLKRHEVVILPSASVLSAIRATSADRELAKSSLAIFANPEYTADGPEHLKYAQRESELVSSYFSEERSAYLALGRNASKDNAMSGILSKYDFIHFAAHAENHLKDPALSSIRLSQVGSDGKRLVGELRVRDIQDLYIPAYLVVLSACNTGIGPDVKGEGPFGLGHAFLYAGAERVVVSLWKVDDESTPELMKQFYYEMLEQKQPPAYALRNAQLYMIEHHPELPPYHWAGFQLQGDWR